MGEFRIDSFELSLQSNGNYTMSGVCNEDASGSPVAVDGVYDNSAQTFTFDTGAHAPDEKFAFTCTGISFTGYSPAQMAEILFGDATNPAAKKRKASVGVINTTYPPPSSSNGASTTSPGSNHDQFSDLFKVKTINLQRISADSFSCAVQLVYAACSKTYSIVGADFMKDPSRPITEVIGISILEENTASGATVLNANINAPGGIPMANFEAQGLCIIVKEDTRPWIDVNSKKALFYIAM